jgi:A/G-specific adenine glycosylase
MIELAEKLVQWYQENKRDLPWRNTKNPYFIWLSEVILQQTRIKQGLPYYEKFIENYPTIQDLANAPENDVLRLWQGLGYYSRARNMHATAKIITENHNAQMPENYESLLKLKGIGKYTAAAIASFAFDENVAVLDGNVYRVLARFFGIELDITTPKAEKEFRFLVQEIINQFAKNNTQNSVSTLNQALMEFGALQCTPQSPKCIFCPLQENCQALAKGKIQDLPVKTKKIKVKERFLNYIIFECEQKLALKIRNEKDIWQGLYEFYLIEKDKIFEKTEIEEYFKDLTFKIQHISQNYTHILTHQKLYITFFHISIPNPNIEILKNYNFFDKTAIENLPKPILIANYCKDFDSV